MIDRLLAASYRAHRRDHALAPWTGRAGEKVHARCTACGLPVGVAARGGEWHILPSRALVNDCGEETMINDPYAVLEQAYRTAADAYERAFADDLAGPCAEACRALAIYYDLVNPAIAITYRQIAESYDAWFQRAA